MARRVLALVLALAMLGSTVACGSDLAPSDTVKMPMSSADFEGESYREVVSDLEAAGFTNVEVEALGDLITGWITKKNSVEKVKVAGDSDFEDGDRFAKDAAIVVLYHSFPKKNDEEKSEESEPEPDVEPTSTPEVVDTPEATEEATGTYKYRGPSYEVVVVDKNVTNANLTNYWVVSKSLDLSTQAFRRQVKAIVTDLAHKHHTAKLIVDVVTNKEIALAEAASTYEAFAAKHGDDYVTNEIPRLEETQYVANYRGGFDADNGVPTDNAAWFEIAWYLDIQDVEQWKPAGVA